MFINTFKKLNNFLVSEKILVQKFPSGSGGDGRVDRRGWGGQCGAVYLELLMGRSSGIL